MLNTPRIRANTSMSVVFVPSAIGSKEKEKKKSQKTISFRGFLLSYMPSAFLILLMTVRCYFSLMITIFH